jgi:hypothetical protein
MAFIADEQVIQTLTANAADIPFTNRVGARGTIRCFDDLNLGTCGRSGKMLTIFLIIITDQMLGTFTERGGFP